MFLRNQDPSNRDNIEPLFPIDFGDNLHQLYHIFGKLMPLCLGHQDIQIEILYFLNFLEQNEEVYDSWYDKSNSEPVNNFIQQQIPIIKRRTFSLILYLEFEMLRAIALIRKSTANFDID